jgi:ribose 5-phosphate isomerase B
MKLALASDHRGYEAKRRLLPTLRKLGHEIEDFGCDSSASCDYPDFAAVAARAVVAGKADAAILLDGTGIGMSLAANKICGVRAALAHDEITARLARENNHCNVLCIGSDLLSEDHLRQIVEIFLRTPFSGGRHLARVEKVVKLEAEEATKHAQALANSHAAPHAPHAPAPERRKVVRDK